MQSSSNSSYSYSTRRGLAVIAIAGLTASSVISAALSANVTTGGETLGDITSGSVQCVVGNPNAYVLTETVDWVWTERMSKYVPGSENIIFDQLVTNKGSLNYCIRWDSKDRLSKSDASKFEAMLNRQFKAWNQWLIGYDCWPYNKINVKIVGWAARDASLFEWSDDSLGKIYTSDKDVDGVPQCPTACYKHQERALNSDTSACEGTPFDMSLWPTQNMDGGAGGDWGQRVNAENLLATLDQDQTLIVSHEIGHGFGLPDFYEETDKPKTDFPACIMDSGTAATVTPSDGWMVRRVLENIKSRYSF
ncbi:Neutral zinc metallopeptidase [Phytophthora cinnamomi]|uniref:Neutral zinc metallopeptidase n=1 Tax=Phytophthora cinnamomi TaxID=4785 RepID=UPI003559FF69|nr:Neutral zinc metallopeptidase [Phytophthora cinnamomi]